MASRPARQRYCRCGAHLAADNTELQCAGCQRTSRDKFVAPPQVPDDFWQTEPLREAFAAQHIGRVARAYRLHPYHHAVYGYSGISQGLLGQWLGLQQPQISRVETGPPIRDLNTLLYWAQVMRIPAWMLWFDLPGKTRVGTLSPHGGSMTDARTSSIASSTHVRSTQANIAALLTAPPEETIAYLQEQWHLLVRADNLFGPAYVLRLIHEQIELIDHFCTIPVMTFVRRCCLSVPVTRNQQPGCTRMPTTNWRPSGRAAPWSGPTPVAIICSSRGHCFAVASR